MFITIFHVPFSLGIDKINVANFNDKCEETEHTFEHFKNAIRKLLPPDRIL